MRTPRTPRTTAAPAKRFTSRPLQAAAGCAVDEDDRAADVRRPFRAEEGDDVADLAWRAEPAGAGSPARSSSDGPSGWSSRIRSVSMLPGAIELTVIPSGPTSRASDLAQPMTPGRTTFESTRFSIGSRTVLDVMFTTRPRPLFSRYGRHRLVRRTTETRRSPTASSTCSASSARAVARGGPPELFTRMSTPPIGLDRCFDQRSRSARARDVAGDRGRADPFGLALEQLPAPREHHDVRAFLPERLRDARGPSPRTPRRRSPSCR